MQSGEKNHASSSFGNYKTDNFGNISRNRSSGTYAAGLYNGATSLGQTDVDGARPRQLHRELGKLPEYSRLTN